MAVFSAFICAAIYFLNKLRTVRGVKLNDNADRVLSWGDDGAAHLWNSHTGLQVAPAMLHSNGVLGASFAYDDSHILTWSNDRMLFWSITPSAIEPSKRFITTTFGKENSLDEHYNKDTASLLTWSDDGMVAVWDLSRRLVVSSPFKIPRSDCEIAFNRQGTQVVTYGGKAPNFFAQLWDTKNGNIIGELGQPQHVTFNREGTFFATWNKDGSFTLWKSLKFGQTRS